MRLALSCQYVPCKIRQSKLLIFQEKGHQLDVVSGLCHAVWWSWGDLNPRPQALFGQIYMFSGLI